MSLIHLLTINAVQNQETHLVTRLAVSFYGPMRCESKTVFWSSKKISVNWIYTKELNFTRLVSRNHSSTRKWTNIGVGILFVRRWCMYKKQRTWALMKNHPKFKALNARWEAGDFIRKENSLVSWKKNSVEFSSKTGKFRSTLNFPFFFTCVGLRFIIGSFS